MFEIGRLTRLNLGYTGEANSRPIEICVADWLADWPGSAIGLLLRRPGEDTFYPAKTSVENSVMKYTPTRADVELPGDGLAQIVLTDENDVELRSRVVRTCIEPSLPGSEAEAPEEPMRPFVDQVLEAAASALGSADNANEAANNAKAAADNAVAAADNAEAAADNAEAAAKRAEEAAGMIGPGGGGTGTVTSVNGVQPDEAGNVEIDIPEPPTKLEELEDDAEHRLVSDTEKAAWDAKSNFSGKYEDLTGKPTIPTKLSEMAADATHRLVTDAEKTAWNAKSTFSGAYADLTGKPTKVSAFENDAGYLTEHQDISHLLPRTELKAELKKAAMDVSWLDGYDIQVLVLTGDTTGISKDNAVTLNYTCNDKDGTARTGSCTLKWQGSSSLAYAKKNYTIKLDTALEMVDGWGAQKKYCLKANFIDHSHARNIVSAQVWGWLVNSRKSKHATMVAAPNYGAIDGFPIAIVLNGEFHGLYTWNIPKDGWMYGMGGGTKEAIVCANTPATDTQFKGETAVDANGLELEYTTDESNTAWIASSLNQLINACIDSWGGDLDTTVAQYIDWESAIDYYLYTVMLDGQDMMCKNYLLATYDGTKWYFGAYDMDSTYGLQWDGKKFLRPNSGTSVMFVNYASDHRLMELILRYKTNALKARWKELRADLLSEGRLERQFENFTAGIPSRLLDEDVRRWPSIPSSAVCDVNQILRWLHLRLQIVDELVNNLPAQETPVEPEQPVEMVNQVPISTDTDGSIYNGTGYKDDARLSSSGGVSGTPQAGSVTTGFIPCTNTDVVRIKGAEWLGASVKYSGHYYLNGYNSAKSFVKGINEGASSSYDVTGAAFSYDDATGVLTIDLSQTTLAPGQGSEATGMAYMRINAYGKGADLIVTINQAITE